MIGLDQMGAKISEGRRVKSLSQRELARRVGVSASLISQIETGKVQPSVATLMALVGQLGLSIDEVLHAGDRQPMPADGTVGESRSKPAEALSQVPPPVRPPSSFGRGSIVQPHEDRAVIELNTGIIWERLTAESDAAVDFILVTYPPGASSSEGDQLLTHAGKEYWYIIDGGLKVKVVFDEYDVGPGDSFSFDCTLPHLFRNDGDVPVQAVVTIVHGAASH